MPKKTNLEIVQDFFNDMPAILSLKRLPADELYDLTVNELFDLEEQFLRTFEKINFINRNQSLIKDNVSIVASRSRYSYIDIDTDLIRKKITIFVSREEFVDGLVEIKACSLKEFELNQIDFWNNHTILMEKLSIIIEKLSKKMELIGNLLIHSDYETLCEESDSLTN